MYEQVNSNSRNMIQKKKDLNEVIQRIQLPKIKLQPDKQPNQHKKQ